MTASIATPPSRPLSAPPSPPPSLPPTPSPSPPPPSPAPAPSPHPSLPVANAPRSVLHVSLCVCSLASCIVVITLYFA
eukprot:4884847-Prymnesium_polylepis.1